MDGATVAAEILVAIVEMFEVVVPVMIAVQFMVVVPVDVTPCCRVR